MKVFDRRLSATIETFLQALAWCRAQDMDIVNLSLGTANPAHREAFLAVLDPGSLIVSPATLLPGSLPGSIGVEADAACQRDAFHFTGGVFYASPYPRPIPGVPVDRNLSGVSFAVANVTGLAAGLRLTTREAIISSSRFSIRHTHTSVASLSKLRGLTDLAVPRPDIHSASVSGLRPAPPRFHSRGYISMSTLRTFLFIGLCAVSALGQSLTSLNGTVTDQLKRASHCRSLI